MPQVTILIPTYNCDKFLLECLGSVLRQNYTDFEILIIDDGSTDGTETLIRSLGHPKIRYYKNRRNLGIVASLNKGLRLAKGEYISRMDADDLMIGNRLEEQIKFLEHNKEYGLVGGSYQIMDGNGTYHETVHARTDPDFLSLALIFRNQFHHAAITMRTEIARKLKYSSKFNYCEDHELWIRFAEISKVANLPGIHLSYRWHEDNSCNKNQSILKKSILTLLSRELDKLGVEHTTDELMIHGSVCFGLGGFMFKDDKRLEELKAWYRKLFASRVLADRYKKEWLESFQIEILKSYCGIQTQPNETINENVRLIDSVV